MTPTLTLIELLDAAQHTPALTTITRVYDQAVIVDADQRHLIEVRAGDAVVSADRAIRSAGIAAQLRMTVHLTDAGTDLLRAA